MRKFHRWIGFLASMFLAVIAGTGVFLQATAIWQVYNPPIPMIVPYSPLPKDQLSHLLEVSLAATLREAAEADVASVTLRMDGDRPRMDVLLSGPTPRLVSLDPETGAQFPPYTASSVGSMPVPRSIEFFSLVRSVHQGYFAGLVGRWISLFCGASLFALGLTGFALYTSMLRQRAKAGRLSPFW